MARNKSHTQLDPSLTANAHPPFDVPYVPEKGSVLGVAATDDMRDNPTRVRNFICLKILLSVSLWNQF
jgi:hypothetical protein